MAITDCLNFGSPDKPEGFWELSTAADGISEACRVLETPVISGNVSLYNETDGQSVYPTPVIGMVGLIEELAHITTQHFQAAGDVIYVLGETHADFNGSELQKLQTGKIAGRLMSFDLETEKTNQHLVTAAIQAGLVQSAHDCAEGGLAIALAESAFDKGFGLNVTVSLPAAQLFSETQSRFVLSVAPDKQAAFEALVGAAAIAIGEVTADGQIRMQAQDDTIEMPLTEAKLKWEETIPCLMK